MKQHQARSFVETWKLYTVPEKTMLKQRIANEFGELYDTKQERMSIKNSAIAKKCSTKGRALKDGEVQQK